MTSKDLALSALAAAFHRTLCERKRPAGRWSEAHVRVDRRLAAKMVDVLHVEGWTVVSAVQSSGAVLSEDFLAVPA